ncbi:MAG: precorrin-6y C5,15-methyltransferase (decarboxylating) subunit CbiE [Phormidesmis sp.]
MSPAAAPDVLSTGSVHVIGVGLLGRASLPPPLLKLIESATLLIGAPRHLEAFSDLPTEAWPLGNFTQVFEQLRSRLETDLNIRAVVLASGDPLFFGIGRLLLTVFPPEQLVFHPQVSAIQLAFSRLKLPWQDATLISVHGRGEAKLVQVLKRGDRKIAVLTDGVLTPGAIAALIVALDLPISYRLWVCENLGAECERLSVHWPDQLLSQGFAPLNVVVLLRQQPDVDCLESPHSSQPPLQRLAPLPLIGLPDSVFTGFPDRPTLMTKREIRLLILGALAPSADQTIWDIGAGTGAVSIELSRLCPTAHLYAIEKTAIGAALIRHNAQRLAIAPIHTIQGQAPAALTDLPNPDCVFIGGSSSQLVAILDFLNGKMATASTVSGRIVLALATLEHLSQVTTWLAQRAIANTWHSQLTQINISRSLPVGTLTRFSPLNPVTLVTLSRIVDPVAGSPKS